MKINENIKSRALLFGWIAGFLFLISVVWIFTRPLQSFYLLRAVNSVFISNNDSRRVNSFVSQKPGKQGPLGYWYTMFNSQDYMFVFTVFQDGILIPLGAVVNEGKVQEVLPLSAHARQVFENLPGSIIDVYKRKIEESSPPGIKDGY